MNRTQLKRIELIDRCFITRPEKGADANIMAAIGKYALNSSEVCRALNGIPPRRFRGCYYETSEKEWFEPKASCKKIERVCDLVNAGIWSRLDRLEKQGKLQSQRMTWIDGRKTNPPGKLPFDKFRFFYTKKRNFAKRLKEDIDLYVAEKYGPLGEIQEELSKYLTYVTPKHRQRWAVEMLQQDAYMELHVHNNQEKALELLQKACLIDPDTTACRDVADIEMNLAMGLTWKESEELT